MLRSTAALLLIAWAALAGSKPQPPVRPQADGESLFYACEFKAAARAFERDLVREPGSARLHFWLGKSYERLADVSSPLSARKNARKAQAHLEAAVKLDPGDRELLMELFDFYVDSPEWFGGGLDRAAYLLERIGPDDGGPGSPSRRLADSRNEFKGPAWAIAKGIKRLSAAAGHFVPQR
jgi:tetratricopeptide (TPR) repeat protein